MFELLPMERLVFLVILTLSIVSSVLAYLQIARDNLKFRRLLIAFTSVQITLGAVLLVLRAAAIKAFPLTGVFESMIILMVLVGITFLFLSAFIQQVWFLSVMAWILLVINILTAVVAKPASVLEEAARTPWAVYHALSMSISGAMIVFSSAMAILFLWSQRCLKGKQLVRLLGKMPTIEKLENLNLLGLRLSFISLTFGLVSGIGLVAVKSAGLGMTLIDWMTDSKIVLIFLTWIILLCTLILRSVLAFSGKKIAQCSLVICFLILFAFIGSKIFCKSDHDFESTQSKQVEQVG